MLVIHYKRFWDFMVWRKKNPHRYIVLLSLIIINKILHKVTYKLIKLNQNQNQRWTVVVNYEQTDQSVLLIVWKFITKWNSMLNWVFDRANTSLKHDSKFTMGFTSTNYLYKRFLSKCERETILTEIHHAIQT